MRGSAFLGFNSNVSSFSVWLLLQVAPHVVVTCKRESEGERERGEKEGESGKEILPLESGLTIGHVINVEVRSS